MPNANGTTLSEYKDEDHDSRNHNVEAEERSETRGEQLAHKQIKMKAMLRQPRNELGIWRCDAENAQQQVNVT